MTGFVIDGRGCFLAAAGLGLGGEGVEGGGGGGGWTDRGGLGRGLGRRKDGTG